jgi:hypothetical protein
MSEIRWHPYTTRHRHIICGYGALPGLKVYASGMACLATRLPDYRVVLTFDDVSVILAEEWYLEGVEDPRLIHPKWVRDIHAIEDANFIKAIEEALERMQHERDPSLPT